MPSRRRRSRSLEAEQTYQVFPPRSAGSPRLFSSVAIALGVVAPSRRMLKYLSEKASKSQFDARRLQGVFTRVLLGASLAYVIVNLLGAHTALDATLPIIKDPSPAAIAFLGGLGVKAVYSALEWTIEGMGQVFTRAKK